MKVTRNNISNSFTEDYFSFDSMAIFPCRRS